MTEIDFTKAIGKFEKENNQVKVLYGGDGILVREWRNYRSRKGGKCLLPIRNYGMCQKHQEFFTKFFAGTEGHKINQFLFPLLRGEFKDNNIDNFLDALSELTITSADPTAAIRFNITINDKIIVENIIANGVIFATKLGSTGYFKSVARTIFTNGIGVGFICPTYSIPNIVTKATDRVGFELVRSTELNITADKLRQNVTAQAGWNMVVQDAYDNVSVLGYDHFMCPECRKNRNSTLVNDNYCIV